MHSKLLNNSQRKVALERLIRSKALSPDQKSVMEYLELLFHEDLIRWLSGSETADPERLRGRMACLKELMQLLSDSKLELFKETTNDR